jgi:hypothetical protein
MSKTGFIYADELNFNGSLANVPPGIRSKTVLLEALGRALHFPDYYGVNWDAFEECIRDLEWLPEGNVVIRHIDLPLFDENIVDSKIYLTILSDAATKGNDNATRRLIIVFPPELQTVIETLI